MLAESWMNLESPSKSSKVRTRTRVRYELAVEQEQEFTRTRTSSAICKRGRLHLLGIEPQSLMGNLTLQNPGRLLLCSTIEYLPISHMVNRRVQGLNRHLVGQVGQTVPSFSRLHTAGE